MKFKDLTKDQKAKICNGCGPKFMGALKAPEFVFGDSCEHHDFRYWKGAPFGKKRLERLRSDIQFLESMLQSVGESDPELRPMLYRMAYRYFKMVRAFGWAAFWWGKPRTIARLDRKP